MKKANHKPQRRQIHLDRGTVLLVTGALANITLWVGAFMSSEDAGPIGAWIRQVLLPILGGISGLAMGVTVAAGLVYVLGRLSHMKATMDLKVKGTKKKYKTVPNPRFYTAWASIVLLLAISPVLLAPYALMILAGHDNIYTVLGASWARVWAVIRVLAADLALAAIAMVHGVQLHPVASRTRPVRTSGPAPQSEPRAAVRSETAPQSGDGPDPAPDMRDCSEPGCGLSYRWPNGKGAHYKKHHPEIVTRRAIPVRLPVDHG